MTFRCTIKCPTLPTNAKGILPDEAKALFDAEKAKGFSNRVARANVRSAIDTQTRINENFNNIAEDLGDEIRSKLNIVDITWCKDGCIVISAEDTLANTETMIADLGFEITTDRPLIRHRIRSLDNNDPSSAHEEDIDEVFEPKTPSEKKLLKSRSVPNKYEQGRVP